MKSSAKTNCFGKDRYDGFVSVYKIAGVKEDNSVL